MSRRILAHAFDGICHILGDVIIMFDYSGYISIGVMMGCEIRCRIIVCNSYSMWYVRIPEMHKGSIEIPFTHGRGLQPAVCDKLRRVYYNPDDQGQRQRVWDYWTSINISHIVIHDIERVVANLLY